ncbi:hypothetical protein ILFOPFJJ_07011 [Ensifer psoraleae]|nr:hypothetical protein [Sinorhizobium psoraleae]
MVEPILHWVFVICEEPAVKAAKNTYIPLYGVRGGSSLFKGLLKLLYKLSIIAMKRRFVAPYRNPT